jgi:hypothetical protein
LHTTDPALAILRGKFCPVVTWSNPTIKGIAKRRRESIATGDRSFIAKGEWNEEFSTQLHSETEKLVRDKDGHKTLRWVVNGRAENHGWDCFCMGLVAAGLAGCLGDLSAG